MATETKPDTSHLYYADGDERTLTVDWRELLGEDCEGFTSAESVDREEIAEIIGIADGVLAAAGVPASLPAIGNVVDISEYEDDIYDEAGEYPSETYIEIEHCEGPMMNYVYPLPRYFSGSLESVTDIESGCICLVSFSDENQDRGLPQFGLALTGGGMDLRWEIAGAYVDLGFRPPFGVTQGLPDLAGMALTPRNALIIQAMRESAENVRDYANRCMGNLDRLEEKLRKAER